MTTITNPTNASRATPNIAPADAVFHIGSSIFIAAPSLKVWQALTDTSTWPAWNPFVPRVTIRHQPNAQSSTDTPDASQEPLSPILQVGTKMTFHVRMDPTSTKPQAATDSGIVVTEYTAPDPETGTPGRITWAMDHDAPGSMRPSLLIPERVHELTEVEVGEGDAVRRGTEVRNWELQVGWLAYVVKCMYGKSLQNSFELWVEGLKRYVEETASE
ncbi:uncharacterized protein N7459_000362 [Penicillium hispanicum]|uniref:uncharacterized protein n=1 Tax=Penicillium hispanicum TaxID=1080232 RepID=UPI00254154F5|nr:uncharacterized protein N7459_000362 [Penicillium hispanicum]KAJ5594154.1 hypothetical protein N7459_000362 [Penicillium hispanicum]